MRLAHPLTAALAAGGLLLVAVPTAAIVGHRHALTSAMVRADPDDLAAQPDLQAYAMKRGTAVYSHACAGCHGADGRGGGRLGMVDLTRPDRLYGAGKVSEIEMIVRHGIRSGKSKGWDLAAMPAFGTAHPYPRYAVASLRPDEMEDVTNYLLLIGRRPADRAAAERGEAIYAGRGQCFDCHQPDAKGDTAIGAPDLTDAYWIYGGTPAQIRRSLEAGRAGMSPAFDGRLSAADQRAVAVYTAGLIRGSQPHD